EAIAHNSLTQAPQRDVEANSDADAQALVLERLMLLYYSGTLNQRSLQKAKKALDEQPPLHFNDDDELLAWLEARELVKKAPERKEAPKKAKKKKAVPPASLKNAQRQPAAQAPKKKRGCMGKLILITLALGAIIYFLFYSEPDVPECHNPEAKTQLSQQFEYSYRDKEKTQAAGGNGKNDATFIFASVSDLTETGYDSMSSQRQCEATVTYKEATVIGGQKNLTGKIGYTVDQDGHVDIHQGKEALIERVKEANLKNYVFIQEKQKIGEAFMAGLRQLDSYLIETQGDPDRPPMKKLVRWINFTGECRPMEGEESERYLCPLRVKYADSADEQAKTFIFNFDMPVMRKDGSWYPTAQFFSLFLDALEKEKQSKKD
ncbi:hypothetical protein, partial [Leminorella grimontii]